MRLLLAALLALGLGLGGCAYSVQTSSSGTQTGFGGGGSGPAAGVEGGGSGGAAPGPAVPHGARFAHPSGVDLVWDAGLGLYVVPDRPGTYSDGRFFYRRGDPAASASGWVAARGPDGPWQAVGAAQLPPALVGR